MMTTLSNLDVCFNLVIGHSALNPPHLFKSVAQLGQEDLKAGKELLCLTGMRIKPGVYIKNIHP